MESLHTYIEIDKLKSKLIDLQTEYNTALKADEPFHHTRKIFEEIKETVLQLQELQAATRVEPHLIER